MSFLINPYAFLAAGGDFESIATVTVGSGGASSIEFTSIPGTYQHLQVRLIGRSTRSATDDYFGIRINGDSSTNYAYHGLMGDGATAKAYGAASQTYISVERLSGASASQSNGFGAAIIDILDYQNTTRNTTVRTLGGYNDNTTNTINCGHTSGVWLSTSAVTSIALLPQAGSSNWAQYSTAALYGIKA